MYHKIIGGKKSKGQRNINKSIEYLLREKPRTTERHKNIINNHKTRPNQF